MTSAEVGELSWRIEHERPDLEFVESRRRRSPCACGNCTCQSEWAVQLRHVPSGLYFSIDSPQALDDAVDAVLTSEVSVEQALKGLLAYHEQESTYEWDGTPALVLARQVVAALDKRGY